MQEEMPRSEEVERLRSMLDAKVLLFKKIYIYNFFVCFLFLSTRLLLWLVMNNDTMKVSISM